MSSNQTNKETNDIGLNELQSTFMNSILHNDKKILSIIDIKDKSQPNNRIKQYHKHYQGKLTKFLTSAYPILKVYLGEKKFNSLCQATISRHPSTYQPADTYKHKLVEYLSKNTDELLYKEVIDLARFENLYSDLFRTYYPPGKTIMTIEQEDFPKWAHYPIQINPSLKLISMKSNAPKVFFSLKTKNTPPELIINRSPSYWTIWKLNNEILFKKFSDLEKELYEFIIDHSISRLTTDIEPTEHVKNHLRHWLQIGIVVLK